MVRSVAAGNLTGVSAASTAANATLRFGESTVTGNANSWTANVSGIVRSYGDNNIDGNADGDPAPTAIPKK